MEIIIKRVHTTEEIQEALSKISTEDISTAVTKGINIIKKARISKVERAISEAFEEAKMDEALKSTISQLDFSSLKQIDAVMRRHRPTNEVSYATIRPENLSPTAINLYVAMVRRVYIGTVGKCSSEYTIQELSTITNGLLSLNQKMTTFGPNDKDKKFYAAEEAMNTLTEVNSEVSKRISNEVTTTKEMILAK